LSGNDQEVLVGTKLYSPLLVEVVDSAGKGVAGVKVDFSVTSGPAKLDAASRITDKDGKSGVFFVRPGDTAGDVVITASLGGLKPVEFTLTANAPATRKMDLELLTAARKGDSTTVETLLNQGADVSAMTERGETPLMFAAQSDHIETVMILLARGANSHAAGTGGGTALVIPRSRG
jgi:hypothetical protein